MRQKPTMIACHNQTGGDKAMTIEIYAALDAAGLVNRESNVTPVCSRDYATILWHTGRRNGWFK